MKLAKVVFFIFLNSAVLFAKQDPYKKHLVEKGETVYSISKKYHVTPFDIYRLNPDAKDGIKENTTLLIPNGTVNTTEGQNNESASDVKTHKVAPKETLFSLAKQYSVSVADLKEWNPEVEKNGLKIGQDLIVSKTYKPTSVVDYSEVQEVKHSTSVSTHVVKTQETLYSISRKYGVSVNELESLNPQIKDEGLKIGDTIKIKKENQIAVTQINNDENLYIVKPKETLFSICKQFNISASDLISLNPELNYGLKEGMKLKLPSEIKIENTFTIEKPKANLLNSIDYATQKELVLLIPFNISKIQADSTKSTKDYIKNSKFLNLTLDFYSGALVAIDSAKKMGLPVNIKILDVESSKNSSNISQIISANNFSNVDAVIGPFVNSHAETTAQLLSKYNIPVISPLSKELSKPYDNLFNAVPTQQTIVRKLFDYLNQKNGNIVAVISPKKNASKELLVSQYSYVKFPDVDDKGSVTYETLKAKMVPGKRNFVILDSEKSSQIMSVSNILMKLKEEFDLQLVVFELYDSLNYEEINMQNLVDLQLLYPSYTKEPYRLEDKVTIEKLRTANGVYPNVYTTKGFDVTFDTLLRICQPEGFVKSVEEVATEGAENGFHYVKENGVWMNDAIYIQYYDSDFTVKQAN